VSDGKRPNCVRGLSVQDSEVFDDLTMPAAVAATMLGSQCASLLQLRVAAVNVGLLGTQVAALAALTRLTHLRVRPAGTGLIGLGMR